MEIQAEDPGELPLLPSIFAYVLYLQYTFKLWESRSLEIGIVLNLDKVIEMSQPGVSNQRLDHATFICFTMCKSSYNGVPNPPPRWSASSHWAHKLLPYRFIFTLTFSDLHFLSIVTAEPPEKEGGGGGGGDVDGDAASKSTGAMITVPAVLFVLVVVGIGIGIGIAMAIKKR